MFKRKKLTKKELRQKLKLKIERKKRFIIFLDKQYLSLGIVLIIYAVALHFAGYHNFDVGQNMRWLNTAFDLDLRDKANNNQIYTAEEAYILGTNQNHIAILLMFGGALMLGYSLAKLKHIKE